MTYYISGGMTGIPNLNFPAFDMAKEMLRVEGHGVVSPADLERARGEMTYNQHMLGDLISLSRCDAIYMLRNWQYSNGARLELHMALVFGLEIRFATDAKKKFKMLL